MHLPLLVPSDCALNLIGVGEHQWQEGRLVMFDDTFQHEAWNRSESTRIVLLMDCWNPHLTPVERVAVKQLIEIISGYQMADRAAKRSGVGG
jgi:aspartate beta-hydroxylase